MPGFDTDLPNAISGHPNSTTVLLQRSVQHHAQYHAKSISNQSSMMTQPTIQTFQHGFLINSHKQKLVPWGTDGRLPLSDLDVDLGSGHTAYSRASLIDLYLCTKFH